MFYTAPPSRDRRFVWLRGNVPAGLDAKRSSVYGASLVGSQALLDMAASTALVAKPILYYYGFLQAGNALMAERLNGRSYQPRGHGLKYTLPDSGLLGDIVVSLDTDSTHGAFQYMAACLGADGIYDPDARCSLAQLHAALVGENSARLQTSSDQPLEFSLALHNMGRHERGVYFYISDEQAQNFPTFERLNEAFPIVQRANSAWRDNYRPVVLPVDESLYFTDPDQFAPRVSGVPSLIAPSGTFGRLPQFLTKWLLLYGLGRCARYSSDIWGKAIQIDGSPDYLPLFDFMGSGEILTDSVLMELERRRELPNR